MRRSADQLLLLQRSVLAIENLSRQARGMLMQEGLLLHSRSEAIPLLAVLLLHLAMPQPYLLDLTTDLRQVKARLWVELPMHCL